MLDSVWRVCGKEFDIDLFIERYPIPTTDDIYRKGEMGVGKKPYKDTGFCTLISEQLNSSENILEIAAFVKKYSAAFLYLKKMRILSVIDIGCTVGTEDQFTKSVNVPTEVLRLLCEHGASLEFSAYPASDEENET